jgi:hypothetical protein
MFFTLMVGALGSLSAPARRPAVDVFYVDGGWSRFYSSGAFQGVRRRRFLRDGGRSWISVSTHQGACHRRFLALMVDAPGSIAPTPPREPVVDVLYVDGGCSHISTSTRLGARHQRFLALMVGALGSLTPAPPSGSAVDVS